MSVKIVLSGMNEMLDRMTEFKQQTKNAAGEAIKGMMQEAENEAKRSAPWTDRTGNARRSITGSGPQFEGEKVVGYLCIGVEYGRYLELSNAGKYRIVWPTIEWEATRLSIWFRKAIL